jgi:hypothetical protein
MEKKSSSAIKETKRAKPSGEGTSKTRTRNGGTAKTGASQYHSGQQHHKHSSDTPTLEREERKENRGPSPNEPEDEDSEE